jgi:hypothetical protein
MLQHGWTSKAYLVQEVDTNDLMLSDFPYVKYLEYVNP